MILYRAVRLITNQNRKNLLNISRSAYSAPFRIRNLAQRSIQEAPKEKTLSTVQMICRKMFGKYLLMTNIVSSGLLMVVGDIAAQEIEYRRGELKNGKHFDMLRMGRMFVVGALFGPLHHYIYNWMERVMPIPNFRNTIRKILIDQIVMSPICIVIFFYSACFMERKTVQETNNEMIEKFPYIYIMDWVVWPAAQYYNFRYLDLKYRVMFVNICTALYDVFLSYMKHDFNIEFLSNR